jgi:hypothetical protein
MKESIQQLEEIIANYYPLLQQLSQEKLDHRYAPGKWSKKEEIGHLIDSAQNNIRRFIEAQYQAEPPTIVYNQDEWVKLSDYDHYNSTDLLRLWILLNNHILIILRKMPEDKYGNICQRREPHTIEWLAADYNKHLKYHLHRILELEPLIYP